MKKTTAKLAAVLLAGAVVTSGMSGFAPELNVPLTVTSYAASAALPAPDGIDAKAGTSSLKLTWSKVDGADAYRVYIYRNGKFEVYKNTPGTSCTVSGLTANTKYRFRISALVKSGSKYKEQKKSGTVTFKTKAGSKLSAPADLSYTADGSSVKLTWSAVKGADKYRVYIFNGSDYEAYKTVSAASCKLKGIKKGEEYSFKVAALVGSGSGYKVQTMSEAVTVTLGADNSAADGGTFDVNSFIKNFDMSLITAPGFGEGSRNVLAALGINVETTEDTENGGKIYRGSLDYPGIHFSAALGFNKNDQMYSLMLSLACPPDTAENILDTLKNKLAFLKYTTDTDADGNTQYIWKIASIALAISYTSAQELNLLVMNLDYE